jgi:hypothetical protein
MSSEYRARMALRPTDGCWHLYVQHKRTPRRDRRQTFVWPLDSPIPTPAQRWEELARLGFRPAPGAQWEWMEMDREHDATDSVWLLAAIDVTPLEVTP